MTILVTCLGGGKGTWIPVIQLIKTTTWDKVFIITSPYFADKLPAFEGTKPVVISLPEEMTVANMLIILSEKFDFSFAGDIAINLFSGSGKEHMAIIAAVLRTGSGLRLVEANQSGIVEVQ